MFAAQAVVPENPQQESVVFTFLSSRYSRGRGAGPKSFIHTHRGEPIKFKMSK